MPVGPGKDEFMNTVVGGPSDAPALVMIPGEQPDVLAKQMPFSAL